MKNYKRFLIIVACLAMISCLAFTFAYFTDRAAAELDSAMKTVENAVDIDINKPDPTDPDYPGDPTDPSKPEDPTDPDYPTNPDDPSKPWDDGDDDDHNDLENFWKAWNAEALGNLNPGDKLALDGKITNSGSLDVDYRQTFIITCEKPMGLGEDDTANTADDTEPEFRLFTDCTRQSTGALVGGAVVSEESISSDRTSITYRIAPATLAAGEHLYTNYDLVFNRLASNFYQGAKITVQYLVEARQANASGADVGWDLVETADFTFGGYDTVPQAMK